MITFSNGEVLLNAVERRFIHEYLEDLGNTSALDFMDEEELKRLESFIKDLA